MITAVLTCVAGTSGVRGVCPEGMIQSVQEAYVIPASEAGAVQQFLQPFDPSHVAAIFGASFSITFFLWFAAWAIGTVVRSVKRF